MNTEVNRSGAINSNAVEPGHSLNKLPLTVVILAHRLDEWLETAIDSAGRAGEVVVAHTNHQYDLPGSRMGVRHVRLETDRQADRQPNFSAWRNQAIGYATQPWTLFLDSDEQIAEESWPELAAIAQADPEDSTGVYTVRRVDYFYGQPLSWGEVRRVELARLGPTDRLIASRPVHEVIAANLPSTASQVTLLHFPHPDISRFITKVGWYARLEAEYRYQRGERFSQWRTVAFPLGKWLYNMGWRLAWRDGWRGVVYATLMSLHSFWVRLYLYEYARSGDEPSPN
ncbi:MAG: hypothetical protein COU69_01925 [Candidatus Pacebacteria bacterium CG10_big_fil_rev_8_21_14_0_10_56_10]|nr:MAG: hypothetical protein COU69_01925 [Candidatus Pacebacteria bacterium CG10_big_fil_rev_8_21_14_0_10_56_10]